MIRIVVMLDSANGSERDRILGVAEIENDCTGTVQLGNYKARFSKWAPKTKETWKSSRVEGFNRQTRGAWDLLYLALDAAIGDRNAAVSARNRQPKSKKETSNASAGLPVTPLLGKRGGVQGIGKAPSSGAPPERRAAGQRGR